MREIIGYAFLIIGIIEFLIGMWYLTIPSLIIAGVLLKNKIKEYEEKKKKEKAKE